MTQPSPAAPSRSGRGFLTGPPAWVRIALGLLSLLIWCGFSPVAAGPGPDEPAPQAAADEGSVAVPAVRGEGSALTGDEMATLLEATAVPAEAGSGIAGAAGAGVEPDALVRLLDGFPESGNATAEAVLPDSLDELGEMPERTDDGGSDEPTSRPAGPGGREVAPDALDDAAALSDELETELPDGGADGPPMGTEATGRK